MAETYTTSVFKDSASKPQGQTVAPTTGAPVAAQTTGGEQYQTPVFKGDQGQSGGGQAQPKAASGPGWGIDWSNPWSKGGPALTAPQSVQDFSDVAGNEASMGLPGLAVQKARLDAARQRLGPAAAAGADLVGNVASPTSFLNLLGPEAAGAAHEGIKSAVANWKPDESWPTYLKNVGLDTAGGAITGLFGRGAAAAAPVVAPLGARMAVQGGIPTVLGTAGHMLFGHGDVYRELAHMGPEAAAFLGLNKAGERATEMTKNLISSPAAQQAIKSLILGGGSAARTAAGPYDQWIPGQ